jgi:hypothetical protein
MDGSEKLSIRLDSEIHAALVRDAGENKRELGEHVQRILTEYALGRDLLSLEKARDLALFASLVSRAVAAAIRICRDGKFGPDITLKAIEACMADPSWAADYEALVRDNPYKHGNPRKASINKEIGYRIREAINGVVVKTAEGKPAKVAVNGAIIQSYTPMSDFDKARWRDQ